MLPVLMNLEYPVDPFFFFIFELFVIFVLFLLILSILVEFVVKLSFSFVSNVLKILNVCMINLFSRTSTEEKKERIVAVYYLPEGSFHSYSLILNYIFPYLLLITSIFPLFLNFSFRINFSFIIIYYLLILVPFIRY